MKTIRKHLQKLQHREEKTTGFLGRADGTVRVPGRKHWVYVRLWNGEIVEAFNNGNVPAAFGLAVNVIYRGGRYYVAPRDAYDQPVYTGLPDGAEEELQWPGLHTLYVRPEQFLPGLVIPKSGLTVIVYGGSLPLAGGGYLIVPTQEIDLTPYVPASNAIWVTLGWSNSGTVLIQTGGAANSIGELSTSNIPTTGGFDLAAIKMFNGQTSISHGKFGSMITDLRFFKPATGRSIFPASRILATDGSGEITSDSPVWVGNGQIDWANSPYSFPSSTLFGWRLAAQSAPPGFEFYCADNARGGAINFVAFGGTLAAPTAITSGRQLGSVSFGGHYGIGIDAIKARISANASQNWSDPNRGTKIIISATPNNTKTMQDVAEFGGDRIDFLQPAYAPNIAYADGWRPYSAVTPIRIGADDPTYTIQFVGVDLREMLYEGMPIRWKQNGIMRYGWISSAPTYSGGNTSMTVLTRTDSASADYDVLNTKTYPISDFAYAPPKQPGAGMPIHPTAWTVETRNTTDNIQSSPVALTWYNPGGIAIVIPIGTWRITKSCLTQLIASPATLTNYSIRTTLSASASSETDIDYHDASIVAMPARTRLQLLLQSHYKEKVEVLAAKSTRYLLCMTSSSRAASIGFLGSVQPIILRAECAYL